MGDFHTDSLGDLKVLASSRPSDEKKFIIKTEKSSGKVWLLMDEPMPDEQEIQKMTTLIAEVTEGKMKATMLNRVRQECPAVS